MGLLIKTMFNFTMKNHNLLSVILLSSVIISCGGSKKNEESAFSFDNVSKQIIHRQGNVTEKQVKTGKAFMQVSSEDYQKK